MTTAYGFLDLKSLFAQRVSTVGIPRIFQAIQESAAEYNRIITELMASFVMPTTVAQEQIELPGGGTLQPLDEHGVPRPVKPSGSYQVAYPVQGGGTAWGTDRVTRALVTVEEANRFTVDAQTRDADWLRRHIMAAILDNTSWVFDDQVGPNGQKGLGNITIQPLANNDAVTYLRKGGSSSADNHYLAQAVAIDNSNNPFGTIYNELNEHPSNSGPFVAYVATSLRSSIEALTSFIEVTDPDVQVGANSNVLRATLARGFGDEVVGKVDKMWIVEWSNLPDGYMICHAQGAGPVLKMREYAASELQGFFPEPFSPDGNHSQTSMIRYAGFGVGNRIGAVAYYVGNASYVIPAAYATPLVA